MTRNESNLVQDHSELPGPIGVLQLYRRGILKSEYAIGPIPLIIGRSPECDVVLADNAVSRRHAKIVAGDELILVKDLGSAHGIQVDNQSTVKQEIRSMDQFSILQYQFRYLSVADYKMEKVNQGGHSAVPDNGFRSKQDNAMRSTEISPYQYNYGAPGEAGSFLEGTTFVAEMFGIVREQWRLISAISVGSLLIGFLHAFFATPMFETDALVRVDPKAREIGGPFTDIGDNRRVNDALVDEVEVLLSRSVLGEVVDDLNLSVKSSPSYFPFIGSTLARIRSGDGTIAKPLIGLNKYGWSNESIVVESMDIPMQFLDQPFAIIAGGNGTYKILDSDGNTLMNGKVGVPLLAWLPSDEPSNLFISELNANPGAIFTLKKIPRLTAIKELRDSLRINDAGIESSTLRISLTGSRPKIVEEVVNKVVTAYVMQNAQTQSEQATRTLQFVEDQIPVAKEKMENAEARLNELRSQRGSIDLPSDTQVVLEKIVRTESQISEIQKSRAQMIERFTPQHPRIVSLDAQLNDLRQNLAAAESEVRELPTTQREVLSISREVSVTSELYLSLVNRAQELQIVSAYAATTGNVRVVDYASLPLFPFRPNRPLLLFIYLMLGMLISGGLILFRRQLQNVVRDPELIEAKLNLPIYATLVHSAREEALRGQAGGSQYPILAITNPTDPTVEGLRSLRTSLQFAFVNADNNVLLITGPTARIGKTFVASNLATVLAASGRSVVVVDADLRCGSLHEQFNLGREPGLADAIGGDIELGAVIHKTDHHGLHVVSAGAVPPNPSELLMHDRFVAQMRDLSAQFDHVIIDSPPVLAVTDPALLSRLAGVVLLVAKCGVHPMREIEQTVRQLIRVGANVRGVVFNDVPVFAGRVYGQKSYSDYARYPAADN